MLAVLPSHIPRERALEEPAVVIMKLQSPYMLQEWISRLRQSAAQMQSVALWHTRQVLAPTYFVRPRCPDPLACPLPDDGAVPQPPAIFVGVVPNCQQPGIHAVASSTQGITQEACWYDISSS